MRHADAAEKSAVNTRKRKTKVANLAAYASLPKHRAFVPLITIWGGLLLALIASVLPSQTIASASSLTGVYLPLMAARLILALGMGILGALLGYIASRTLAHRVQAKEGDRTLVSTYESRAVQPINPVADLGSESFDAPIDKNEPIDEGDRPRALDLNEFASIPGRDAVWVSEPNVTAGNAAEKIAPEPSKAPMPESALEKLRQTPTQDLSLVQMVERFAAALHQRQTHERASISSGEVAREAVLAEALKALAMFTGAGFDNGNSAHSVNSQIDKTEAELKDAIARLQEVRGAA